MTIELVIDVRERELIKRMEKVEGMNIIVSQLEIGDIIFRCGEENILVLERKTVNDLKASICDGRSREQKTRLLGTICKSRIMYLVEGCLDKDLNDKIFNFPVDTLVGSLINTQFRDGIKVYKTASIYETVQFLIKLKNKLEKNVDDYFNDDEQIISDKQYCSSLKKSKKSNMTPKIWFMNALCLIPQLTDTIAEVIVARYICISKLVEEYKKTPEHLRCKLLSDINYELKTGKSRRIGDKLSERVYNFFYNINEIVE